MLRAKGVTEYSGPDPNSPMPLSVKLGPLPMTEKEKAEIAKVMNDPRRQKRMHYEVQFNRPVNDKELDALPELG